MKTTSRFTSTLLVVDVQSRLLPAISGGPAIVANVKRLVRIASLLNIPIVATEHNAQKLGTTVGDLLPQGTSVVPKMTFDACRSEAFQARLPPGRDFVVAGCEAHVCVLQTVLGLLEEGHRVFLVGDAVGSRAPSSRDAALARASHHGADVVTTEMVAFEWLDTAEHPNFRDVLALIR